MTNLPKMPKRTGTKPTLKPVEPQPQPQQAGAGDPRTQQPFSLMVSFADDKQALVDVHFPLGMPLNAPDAYLILIMTKQQLIVSLVQELQKLAQINAQLSAQLLQQQSEVLAG